ncbi:hypothetical protein M422DRAFT_272690 [Sphaerobolus stellatus SS14]|uniref:Protein kinase domain-containing protein n=1 Tax=Sphaerobolus stellatus (strain SS14) TaxID=990650 RepID=A0A0C9ULU2_SPHS4|nr:hypothetical protein M422DRAFT_272690 [Sphaerobolus stellatus SS14]
MLIVRKILTKKKQRIAPLDSDAWILDAINIAKTAASASKCVPGVGSFIEGGATLFYSALEQLKQMRKNKEDFKGLSEAIAILLQTFSDATAGRTSDSTYPERFVRVCVDFKGSMERLTKEIDLLATNSETKRLKTYLRANNIQETIAGYQTEIQRLRDNLMFYCTLSTSVRLFEADRLTGSSDEDFPELKDFRQVLRSDIYLKGEISVGHRQNTRSTLFKEYHTTISFNGKEHSTTTRSYEGEWGQERLKAELKLLARICHPNITQVAAVCFSKSFPSIVYYDDLQPIDQDKEYQIEHGPYTISYLTQCYRQMRDRREALCHITEKLPSFFIGSARDFLDSTANVNLFLPFGLWEMYGRGILRVNILRMPFQTEAPPRTNSSQQDMEEGSIGGSVVSYSDNYISENTLRQIECQEERTLDPRKEVITSSLRALFSIIPYSTHIWHFRVEPRRAKPPLYLGVLYCAHHAGNGWDRTPMGEEPVGMLFPLESHHYKYDNWTAWSDPEHAEWEARTHMTRGIRLKFDLSYCPDSTGSFRIWCAQSLTQSKRFELLHASMAQLCHIKGILEDSFLGKFDSHNLQSLLLVTDLRWRVKVWKPVKRPNSPSVSELYLFIDDPVINQGHTEGPEVYWSKCPDGTTRITTLELYALGIERPPVVWLKLESLKLNLDLVDMLRDFYQSCGLNPFSNKVSNLLELPLPQHVKLEPKQLKRRLSFSAYQQKLSRRDKILQANEIDFKSVYRNLDDGMTSLLPFVSDYLPEEYQLLQEFNRRLGTKVAKYWAFMAAPELLPESLKLYDLRTTGHDFEYGETRIDPLLLKSELLGNLSLYDIHGAPGVAADVGPSTLEVSIAGWFGQRLNRRDLASAISLNVPKPHILVILNPVNSTVTCTLEKAGTYDPTRLFGITTLDVVHASRFLSGIAGTDPAQTPVSPSRKDGAGSATLNVAYAAAATFTVEGVEGRRGDSRGVAKIHDPDDITAQEQELVNAALPQLKKNIEKGFAFVQ